MANPCCGVDFNIKSTVLGDDDENKNDICASYSDSDKTFPIESLPLELLFIIIKKLDTNSFNNCLVVNRRLQSVTISIANADKSGLRWKSIHDFYLGEENFRIKSYGLSYKESFANSLRWNLDFSLSLSFTCRVQHVKKINIYRDNIIVINHDGVKYFDVHTHKIKKQLQISECYDFVERDAFVLKGTQYFDGQTNRKKLFLYGKSKPTDDGFEKLIQNVIVDGAPQMNNENTVLLGNVSHYAIENKTCYVMDGYIRILVAYIWRDNIWRTWNMGRFYGNRDDDIYTMNVHNSEIFLLSKCGKLLTYSSRNFKEVSRICMPNKKNVIVKLVHKYCLVFGVPAESSFNIIRIRKNDGYNFYKMACPDLTCVTQHGEMLLLGFSVGMIQIFKPKAPSRDDMLKRRILISDFVPEPLEPEDLIVISIDVFEDTEHLYLFIATHSAVYQLLVKHTDETCLWDTIPEPPVYYKYPIRTRFV